MWNREDYEQAASKVAQEFAASNGEQSINQLSTKLARENCLNPEGIRTLVRLSNTAAFQELFAKRAGAEDRMIEYETGDPEIVIANLHNEQVDAVSNTSSFKLASTYDRALDYFGDFSMQKTAEECCNDPCDKASKKDKEVEHYTGKEEDAEAPVADTKQMNFLRDKVRGKLDEDKKEASFRWGAAIEKAAQEYRVSFAGKPSFSKVGFFQDAVAALGAGYLPELKGLNQLAGGAKDEDILGGFKAAHVEQYVLPVLDAPIRKVYDHVKEAFEARREYEKNENALKMVEA
jgi:hypothetical protein